MESALAEKPRGPLPRTGRLALPFPLGSPSGLGSLSVRWRCLPVVLVFLAAVFFSSVFPGPWGLVALCSLGLVFGPPWSLFPALGFVPAPSVLGCWCWAGPLLSAVAEGAAFAPGLLAGDLVGGPALPTWVCIVLLLPGSAYGKSPAVM